MDRSARKHSRQESDRRDKQRKNRHKPKFSSDNSMASGDALRRKKGMSRNAEGGWPAGQMDENQGGRNSLEDLLLPPLPPQPNFDEDEDEANVEDLAPPPPPPELDLRFDFSEIILRKLYMDFDEGMPHIDETAECLEYTVPHFRANAWVEIPPFRGHFNVEVGWVHVCTSMVTVNNYGDHGCTSWEIPILNDRSCNMLNDTKYSTFPWCGRANNYKTFIGPLTLASEMNLIPLEFNISSKVNWVIPSGLHTKDPSLTFVYVKNLYTSYLAAKHVATDQFYTIRTIEWNFEMAIDVDPSKELGNRAKFIGPCEQEVPVVKKESEAKSLETQALTPPTARKSQVFVWRPKNADPTVLLSRPPSFQKARYVKNTRDYSIDLEEYNKKSFLIDQKDKMTAMKIWK